MVEEFVRTGDEKRKPGGLMAVGLAVLAVLLGLVAGAASWTVSLMLIVGILALWLPWHKPDWALYLMFFALIMTTDEVGGRQVDFFAIPDADMIQGLPPMLTSYFLFMFATYFIKLFVLEREESRIAWKYLAIYAVLVGLAALTGMMRGNDMTLIRVDLMNMLFPVLCFYLVVNVLKDPRTIGRMLGVVMAAALIKSVILLAYYFAGRGWPYSAMEEGSYRIATMDSADLLSIITMILLIFSGWACRRIRGRALVASAFALLLLAMVVLFADRRAQWVGLVLSLGLMYVWATPASRWRMMSAGGLMLFLMVCVVVLTGVGDHQLARLGRRSLSILDGKQDSNQYHLLESQQTLRDIAGSPLVGLGLGGRHSPLGLYDTDEVPDNIVHNAWLYIWMKMGLPGAAFFMWALWRFFKMFLHFRRVHSSSEAWPWGVAMASSFGLWLAMSLTGPVPWYFHQTYLIALFAALGVALMKLAESGEAVSVK
ncbi:MAG: O-antigen ligase family protein [Lentisphaerota bacterium]